MPPESIEKTAFSTPDGHDEFLRLPIGLKNATAEFIRIMHQVLGNLKFVEIYLDDIPIHSKTFDEHMSHIKIVFDKLREANVKINHEKLYMVRKVSENSRSYYFRGYEIYGRI